MSAFKTSLRNPDTKHTYNPGDYLVTDVYTDHLLCMRVQVCLIVLLERAKQKSAATPIFYESINLPGNW